jgi:hypothetical protein
MNRLSRLLALIEADKRARLQRIAHERKMAQIGAASPENLYQQRLRWLSATGQGGEIKKMLEERK